MPILLDVFGMKKTHYNNNIHHHHHHHHQHSFSSPILCQLCLRSFTRKITNFPSSMVMTFLHKLDFQLKRLSYFVKNTRKILLVFSKTICFRSRSEQAPRSEFHPRDESEKNDCGFLGPSWFNKKVNPET